jgi:hypothetical protein
VVAAVVLLVVIAAVCLAWACWLMWGGTLEMGPHWNPRLGLHRLVHDPIPIPEAILHRLERLSRLRELTAAAFAAGGLAALGVAAFLGLRLRRR